jgi:hypothetical protein
MNRRTFVRPAPSASDVGAEQRGFIKIETEECGKKKASPIEAGLLEFTSKLFYLHLL